MESEVLTLVTVTFAILLLPKGEQLTKNVLNDNIHKILIILLFIIYFSPFTNYYFNLIFTTAFIPNVRGRFSSFSIETFTGTSCVTFV